MRSWTPGRLKRLLTGGMRRGWLRCTEGRYRFTEVGEREASRVVRNHRLWEIFLITHAEIAPSHVDRDADMIEHVLGPDMLGELERLLAEESGVREIPPSPHAVAGA
jgi:manganese/zinc/iron transport system permease protein